MGSMVMKKDIFFCYILNQVLYLLEPEHICYLPTYFKKSASHIPLTKSLPLSTNCIVFSDRHFMGCPQAILHKKTSSIDHSVYHTYTNTKNLGIRINQFTDCFTIWLLHCARAGKYFVNCVNHHLKTKRWIQFFPFTRICEKCN